MRINDWSSDVCSSDLKKGSEIGVIEAVVNTESPLIGQSAGRLRLQERYGVNLIAVSRRGERLVKSLGNTVLRAGDVVVLQGALDELPEKLRDLGALPLAERAARSTEERCGGEERGRACRCGGTPE